MNKAAITRHEIYNKLVGFSRRFSPIAFSPVFPYTETLSDFFVWNDPNSSGTAALKSVFELF